MALFGAWLSDRTMIVKPDRALARHELKMGESLADDHGLFLLLDFDGPEPIERVSGTRINQAGVESVPGVFGHARRFDGRHSTFIESDRDWLEVGPAFSISARVFLDAASPHQEFAYSGGHRGLVGLALRDGQMTFHVPPWNQTVSYPFESYGRFVHIAAVADGRARLYEDGMRKAEATIESVRHPDHGVQFGKTRWDVTRHPLMGALDETAVWTRALSEEEVRRLHRSRKSLLATLRPRYYRRWQWMRQIRDGLRTILKTADHFNPRLHPGRIRGADMPDIHLYLSRNDLRWMARAHRHSRETGRRVREAARGRRIGYVADGKAGRGVLRLLGGPMDYSGRGREGFELDLDTELRTKRGPRLHLVPPELLPVLLPLTETRIAKQLHLPAVPNGLCRVHINNRFHGVYYFEEADRMGVIPGAGEALFFGPVSPGDWRSRFQKRTLPYRPRSPLHGRLPLCDSELETLAGQVARDIEPWLIHDTASALSSREIRRDLRRQRRRIHAIGQPADSENGPARRLAATINPYMFLQDNPSPFYLVDDLDLSSLRYPDVSLTWSSSDPDILTEDGVVTRPDSGGPREIALAAILADETERIEKTMRFRVVPRRTAIGAVMLYANETLSRVARVDTEAHFYPPGTDVDEPRVLTGSQGARAGLKHRGGTGHWRHKKPFSLKTDVPHHWLDDTATRHVYFASGYVDGAFMRNKLAYDLWKSFSEPGAPRYAPEIAWAEVFVNGVYHGLYEMGTRVQRRMLGFPAYRPGMETHGQICKILDIRDSIQHRSAGSFIQKYPLRRHGFLAEPFMAFLDALDKLDGQATLKQIADVIDLDNAADFHLFLNIIEGSDNLFVNFYLARAPDKDAPFFFAVFDCDKTFQRGGADWYRNHAIRRMETPDFLRHAIRRWHRLRAGPAQPERLLGQVDEMERLLADFMPWEYERWSEMHRRSFPEFVKELRQNIQARMDFMDAEMHRLAKDMAVSDSAQETTRSAAAELPRKDRP